MEVILLEKVRHLGSLGDKVKVRPGFGRNFLLPKRKAVSATKANLEQFEARRAELEKLATETLKAAQARAEKISAMGTVTIAVKVAEEGKLYGSVGVSDITHAMQKAGLTVEKSEVKLPTGPIRHIGEYDVSLYLHSDVVETIKVNIVSE